jgi:hypothetical protein
VSALRTGWLACALCAACAGGSETGNPARPTEIALSVHTSDAHAVALASSTGDARIDQAWVAFARFEFFAAGTCKDLGNGNGDEHRAPLIAADLAKPGVKAQIDLAPGKYCGVVVPINQHTAPLPAGAPAELGDHSIVVRGKLADGTPFLIAHPEQDELELGALNDTFTAEPNGASLLFSFDVARWLLGLDLGAAARERDGSIQIDEAHNGALLDAFEANVECALELYRDVDGDGTRSAGDALLARCTKD